MGTRFCSYERERVEASFVHSLTLVATYATARRTLQPHPHREGDLPRIAGDDIGVEVRALNISSIEHVADIERVIIALPVVIKCRIDPGVGGDFQIIGRDVGRGPE